MKTIFITIVAVALVLQIAEARPEAEAPDAKNENCIEEIDQGEGQEAAGASYVEYRKLCKNSAGKKEIEEIIYKDPNQKEIIMEVAENVRYQ